MNSKMMRVLSLSLVIGGLLGLALELMTSFLFGSRNLVELVFVLLVLSFVSIPVFKYAGELFERGEIVGMNLMLGGFFFFGHYFKALVSSFDFYSAFLKVAIVTIVLSIFCAFCLGGALGIKGLIRRWGRA